MTDQPKNEPHEEPESTTPEESREVEAEPAAEASADQPTPEEPEEVTAEPVEPGEAQEGPTLDMPPPGETSDHAAPGTSSMDVYGWAAACHLLGLLDMTFSFMLIGILAPLVLWLARKDTDSEVAHAGKEALNFQLNLLFWWIVSAVLAVCLIGIPLLIVLPIIEIVLVTLATIETLNGKRYRYPWILRIIE